MASRDFDSVQVLGKARKDITGSFKPNGASTSVTGIKGNGFTVAHTAGAPTYTVTFQDQYFDFDSAWCHLESATLGQAAQIVAELVPNTSPNTLTIQVYTTSTAAGINDLAAGANTRVHFGVRFKNTSGNF